MASEFASLVVVSAAAAAFLAYARFATARLAPGVPRLAALLPVFLLLPVLPFAFSSIHLRTISAFFLVWLCAFKLLLLAAGQGPLHPSLPLVRFAACAALPVKIRDVKQQQSSRSLHPAFLLSYAAKAALFTVIVSLRCFRPRMPVYAVAAFDGAHVYLMLELFLASAAALARALLGAELEPQFDRPYLASSLRDFWGRRWNLMVPGVLRPCVYRPVRARLGSPAAGVLAAFLVSGLMHEVMFYYITLEPGTGEVTAFFALHGACAVAEAWLAWRSRLVGWRTPPRPVATALTLAFVTGTGSWLFFAPVIRSGLDKAIVAECEAMGAFLEEAARNLAAATGRLVWPATS